jgi:hypothetical protein
MVQKGRLRFFSKAEPYKYTRGKLINQENLVRSKKRSLYRPGFCPLKSASFDMFFQPGSDAQRMGRKSADTLVGMPPTSQGLQRNYSAAGARAVDSKTLRFRLQKDLQTGEPHYSLYVKGFILDKVAELRPASQDGAIPREWADLDLWANCPDDDPPDEFWRTLVADRGRDGKNPPVYFSRACKDSFQKDGLSGGAVNTSNLINDERCSVLAQFCRRVQSVIWNRALIRTAGDKLGLGLRDTRVGDLICILYGCNVPVILRPEKKKLEDILKGWDKHLDWMEHMQKRAMI